MENLEQLVASAKQAIEQADTVATLEQVRVD